MNVYPELSWAEHMRQMDTWKQGDHLLVSGPTKSGKTTIVRSLLDKRTYRIALFTKLHDPTIEKEYKGWKRFEEWPKHGFTRNDRDILIWPKPEKTMQATIRKQRTVLSEAIDKIAKDRNRAVFLDELVYLSDPKYMNLASEIGMLFYFGRSSGISAIGATQRPFYIPKIILSSITFGYFARTYDRGDMKRLAELGSMDANEVGFNLKSLKGRHDFVFLNPQGDLPSAIVNTKR